MAEKEEERQSKHWIKAEMDLAPIWDARNELYRLRGIVALVAHLTCPGHLKDDDEYEVFHEAFIDIEEHIGNVVEYLDEAIETMKIKEEIAGRQEKAPDAVRAAAGA